MFEFAKCVWDILGHVDIDEAIVVVPMEGEATVVAASPIGSDGIFSGEDGEEMEDITNACVLDAKVINA